VIITFFIPGVPTPGGSKRAFVLKNGAGQIITRPNGAPAVVITDAAGKKNKEWKQQCAVFAKQNYSGAPLTGPLKVTFEFYRTRPKAHFRSNGQIKESFANEYPTTKPDVTKLIRAAEDAMTGILWIDDSQIVRQISGKSYSDTPGLYITVEELSTQQPPGTTVLAPQAALAGV